MDDEGRIRVPSHLHKQFAGRTVYVRLTSEEISSRLKKNGVTEEEMERIARVQLESREQVTKFLLAEGALKNSAAFVRRAKGTGR
jgi:dephospho-CoA kinase